MAYNCEQCNNSCIVRQDMVICEHCGYEISKDTADKAVLLRALDAINNDTGDWLSEELDMPAKDLIQAIHNLAGKAFEIVVAVTKNTI